MAEFLFEIGLEEVPARMIAAAEAELKSRVVGLLRRESLLSKQDEEGTTSFSSPRRLAVLVPRVMAKQSDSFAKVLGPAVKIAYKDGAPGPAAEAFARKNGLSVGDLKVESTAKGDYLVAETEQKGRAAAEVIAEHLPKELAAIYWAKNMSWRIGRPERFVRPVRWLLCLLDREIVPVSFAGFTASNTTRGHRVLAPDAAIPVVSPAEYEPSLRAAFVLADVEARRHKIRKALDRVCRLLPECRWREDHALVDKLTHLTEWPTVISGSFDPDYLALPEEVLVTVMRDHQSYLAVEDQEGKLAPHFLAVLNTEADPAGEAIIRHGNERVLRARFNDARFFWEFDQRIPLLDRLPLLEKVTFQKDLGSYAAKTARVRRTAAALAQLAASRGFNVDIAALDEAALLAKTDLTAELVKEFTELQGEIGGLYARAQGYPPAVADAIYDQYRPASMDAKVPRTPEGALLALADKVDTITGMFELGLGPTGSKDPFALRRAANGIVKILAEATPAPPLTLGDIADAATTSQDVRTRVEVFLAERLEFYLREAKGQAYDVVKAVLAVGANDVRDTIARSEAVTAVRGSEDFTAVSSAFKRMKNILAQAEVAGELPDCGGQISGLIDPAEKALSIKERELAETVKNMAQAQRYIAALEAIATLRPEVDSFFDNVMVMDPDPDVRKNRLWLLRRIVVSFSGIADFSEIVVNG